MEKFGKVCKSLEKFGKGENDLVFLENDRSFARRSECSCHEPRLVDFDACWKYNTLYNGSKIVSPNGESLEKFSKAFPKLFQTFPKCLEKLEKFEKSFGKKW